MRIRKLSAAIALGVAGHRPQRLRRIASTRTVSRYQAMPAPQGQTLLRRARRWRGQQRRPRIPALCRARCPAACRRRATRRRPMRDQRNMVVQFGYGVDRGQSRAMSPTRFYGHAAYGGFGDPFYSPVLFAALRLLASATAFLLRLGRSVLVRRPRHRQLCRISQPARPPHPRRRAPMSRCSMATPRRVRRRTGWTRRPEPGRGHVHRLPGPQRRDGEDHHPAAAGSSSRG